MPGEREARGKGTHSAKKNFDLHEIDSLPLAAYRRSAGNDNCFYLSIREAFFLQALQCSRRAGIGFLQIDAPIAQRFEGNPRARDSADHIGARRDHAVFAIEILQNGGPAADVAFELVHAGSLARQGIKNQALLRTMWGCCPRWQPKWLIAFGRLVIL